MRIGIFVGFCLILLETSCDKTTGFIDPVLIGTWDVTKVSGQQIVNGNPTLINLMDNNPTGTIRFNSDGSGFQDYSFTIFGFTQSFNGSFRWDADSSAIMVDRFNAPDMIWRREINELNRQQATFTIDVSANETWDYTLTLEK